MVQMTITPPTGSLRSLNPLLGRALANLDVRLEEELTRYRREKAGASRVSRHALRKNPTLARPLELISVGSNGRAVSTPTSGAYPAATHGVAGAPPPPPLNLHLVAELNVEAPKRLAGPAAGERVDLGAVESDLSAAKGGQPLPDLSTDPRMQLQASHPQGELVYQPAPPAQPQCPKADGVDLGLGDYLESSEELLRDFDPEDRPGQSVALVSQLMTPFGVGSMLLLLLASSLFGYLLINPASLQGLASLGGKLRDRLSNLRSVVPTQPAAAPTALTVVPGGASGGGGNAGGNAGADNAWAQAERLSLESLPTLGRPGPGGSGPAASLSPLAQVKLDKLQPDAPKGTNKLPALVLPAGPPVPGPNGPTIRIGGGSAPVRVYDVPQAAVAPAAAAPRSAPSYPVTYPQAPRYVPPAPAVPAAPQRPPARNETLPPPAELPPIPVEAPAPALGRYQVETDFTGDDSYDAAQTAAPNAQMSEDGKIRATFDSSEAANRYRQKLQDQGIEASEPKKQ
jgi:hypothetical protein